MYREAGASTTPSLRTERLVLRPFVPEDAPAVRRLAGDRAVADTTLSIPHPYEEGMAEVWITSHRMRMAKGDAVVLAVVEAESGELAGAVGLEIQRSHESAELGYWIGRPYWGRGYAPEAGRALVRHGFLELGLRKIHASHFARNSASGRVMQKLGMRYEGCLRDHVVKWGRPEDLLVYGILRSEYGEGLDGEAPAARTDG